MRSNEMKEVAMIRTCLVLMGLSFYGVSTAAADVLCGATIVDNLKLDHDLTCAANGLVVAADGITLNLQGHTIAGPGSDIGISVIGRSNVSIVGGTIQGFATGVLVNNSTGVVLKDNQLVANGDGLDLQAGSVGNTVKDNLF